MFLYYLVVSVGPVVMFLFLFLLPFFSDHVARGLSILLIFKKTGLSEFFYCFSILYFRDLCSNPYYFLNSDNFVFNILLSFLFLFISVSLAAFSGFFSLLFFCLNPMPLSSHFV